MVTDYINRCLTVEQVRATNGSVIENTDGSVSLFQKSGDKLIPVKLNKNCCETLSPNYVFDENTQKCMWGTPSNCEINNSYKLTLNPTGNDGAVFNVFDNETCSLNIEFDYLFKVSCKSLMNMLTNTNTSVSFLNSEVKFEINKLQNDIEEQTVLCETISTQIDILQQQIDNTPYSVECGAEYITPESLPTIPTSVAQSFENTGFGDDTKKVPIDDSNSEYKSLVNQNVGTYCLTDDGLDLFKRIIGDFNYSLFLNGDSNSYTCADIDVLIQRNINNNLIYLCNVPFGSKTELLNQKQILEQQLSNCNSRVQSLINELNALTESGLVTSECNKPINFFETLDVTMTLYVVENNQSTSVYEAFDVFPAIGNGNLYEYLSTTPESGFYVYDETTGNSMKIKSNIIPDSCKSLPSNLLNDLSIESGLSVNETLNKLTDGSFSSKWLSYSTIITDPNIIALIADKKIKISLNINNTCTDICVLLDNIKLNKDCSRVTKTNIFVTNCPGFELDRIRDNKKSWISNTTLLNRDFKILNSSGANPIRQTNYNTEDERLVLNSKEIDLDINLSMAIETDVWKYISDNPCLLTGTTNCNECLSGCCGDNLIDFNSLLTQPLSAVTIIEDFQYYLTSELIDVKNRRTLSSYPTLRALYDRYMSSSDYCSTNSSEFDYKTMEEFSDLVGDYWVDIVEQVIPATTIWGSVKIYSNTIFDTQKFAYKPYTSFFCENPFYGTKVPSPINGTSGITQSVGLSLEKITTGYTGDIASKCNDIRIVQLNYGSEFIGQVSVTNTNNGNNETNSFKFISSD